MTVAKDRLRSFVERIERLEEEKKSIADDIRDVYAEAKGNGFDTKALREIIKLRKVDADERAEHQSIVETYMHALGMLADTPLGRSAIAREFDDTKVTISGAGLEPIATTAGDVARAARNMSEGRATSLTKPTTLPDKKSVKRIADRAEGRA